MTGLWRSMIREGSEVGRWYVLRYAPAEARPSWPSPQAKVVVQCLCGREKAVLLRSLALGYSRGCRSARCRHAWLAAGQIVEWAPHLKRRDVARGLVELEPPPAAVVRDVMQGFGERALSPLVAVRETLARYGLWPVSD